MKNLLIALVALTIVMGLLCLTSLKEPVLVGIFFFYLVLTGGCAVIALVLKMKKVVKS